MNTNSNYNGSKYMNNNEWSGYENKLFETTLAGLDVCSGSLYEQIMCVMPWKSVEQIKSHYEKLIEDVAMIENGDVCTPNYGGCVTVDNGNGADHNKRKVAPSTEEEHRLVLFYFILFYFILFGFEFNQKRL